MKNTAMKVLLIITIISSIFLCLLLVLLLNKGKGNGENASKLKEFQEQYNKRQTDTKTIAPEVYRDFSKTEEFSAADFYDIARHTQVYERIEALKRDGGYTADNPLVIWNPYGVNAQSVYVYFKSQIPSKVSYRVSVQAEGISTFSSRCFGKETYATEHEYLLIGLTAGQSNRVSLVLEDAEGNSGVRTFYVEAGERYGIGKEKLDMARGVGAAELSDGLFAHFGNMTGSRETIQLYDNDGILRSEFPVLSGSAKRFLFLEDRVYFNCSDTQMVALNSFGRVESVYPVTGYTIGADYCLDESKRTLLVLASKDAAEGEVSSVDDILLSVDLLSGNVTELVDMGVILNEYKALCEQNNEGILNWLGLNSVQMWDDGGVLLGAREPSAAFKIKDVYGIPMLDYIVGDELMFEGTGYESNLLTKTDDFESFAGANTFTCVKDESMPSGVYELYLYDNHIAGTDSRPELDYSGMAEDLGATLKRGTASYFSRYLVNETARTWELLETVPLDYSGYMGGAQVTEDGHLITVTAGRFAYSEFDGERNLIRKYTTAGTEYLARVFKYDFKGFFFPEDAGVSEGTAEKNQKQ